MLKQSVYQFANGIHICQLRLLRVSSERPLEGHDEFHALHGVEPEIEFKVIVRMNLTFLLTGMAEDVHRQLNAIASQPEAVIVIEFALCGDCLRCLLVLRGSAEHAYGSRSA